MKLPFPLGFPFPSIIPFFVPEDSPCPGFTADGYDPGFLGDLPDILEGLADDIAEALGSDEPAGPVLRGRGGGQPR